MLEYLWPVGGILTMWVVFPQIFYGIINMKDAFEVFMGIMMLSLIMFVWPLFLCCAPISFLIASLGDRGILKGYWKND